MFTPGYANLYIHIGSTLVEALACYGRGRWFEPSNLHGLSLFCFLLFIQTCVNWKVVW